MKRVLNIIANIIVAAIIVVPCIYIMFYGIGLVDSLDFGAGAYYYADIPHFQNLVNGNAYDNHVPMGVLILLFLVWGALMYKLWAFLEKKWK